MAASHGSCGMPAAPTEVGNRFMAIQFRCNYCRSLLGIAESQAGCTVDCPRCGRTQLVPGKSPRTDSGTPVPDLQLRSALSALSDLNATVSALPANASATPQNATLPQPILLIDGLRPEIRTTRYTGLLLATATAVVFGCGFFLGRSLQQPAAAERSPQIDVVKQQQPTEKPLPPQAAQPPQSLTGRIQIQRNGKQQPDSGALVILLPLKNPTRLRFDGSALHTEKDNPARLATIAALSQLHAHFDQAADDGSFSLHYDTQTPAALLVISRHLAGPPGNPLPADCELLINQWFESTAGLAGRLATKLHPLPADQPLTPVSLTFQDATP